MKQIATLLCLCLTSFSYAQEVPPTLSFGLDKVLFGKGVIDVELLTDIIAEKQDELKARIIEQHILEPVFKNTSFATRNYVFSVVRDLLHEKDKNVLKKQVMEQTVNYAVIYAMAELYVANSSDSDFAEIFGKDCGFKKGEDNLTSALYGTKNWELTCNDEAKDKDSVAFNDLLMDCILQAVISNDNLKNKGFLSKPFYFNLQQFQELSYYHLCTKHEDWKDETVLFYQSVKEFVDNISELYESFELLEKYLLDTDADKKEFDIKTFKTSIVNRMSNLVSDLDKSDTKVAEELVKRIKNDLSGIDYLKSVKREYIALTNEMASKYNLENASNYFESPTSLSYDLVKVQDKYKLDSVLLAAVIENKNFSALAGLKHQEIGFDVSDTNISVDDKLKKTKISYDLLNQRMRALSDYISNVNGYNGLIFNDAYLADEANRNNELKEKAEKVLTATYQLKDINMLDLNDLLDELQEELFHVAQIAKLELTPAQDSIIADLFESFYFLKYNQSEALNLSYISFLHNEVLPKIQMLNIKAKGNLTNTSMLIERIAILMEYKIVQSLLAKLENKLSPQFKRIFENQDRKLALSFFLKFFEHLDRLDEIDTYYYLLEQIKVAGEQCDNRDVANAISLITQSVEKYSKFIPEEEKIDLDVELIIGALYDRYGNRDKNPLNFHLTLGLNNAFALKPNTLVNGEGASIRNLGYASEKIGIRLNIWNFAMRHTYLDGETKPRSKNPYDNPKYNYNREPLISNIHCMLYASGFLYQLADLGTTKDIKATFVGSGLGATFYNNLNFNLSYLLPVQYDGSTKLSNGAINVGFDIYFGEYITALNKKRKENKKLKLEAEANSSQIKN